MAYFASVVLSLISSLELVLQARHNVPAGADARPQLCRAPPASAGPAGKHLPPSGPSSHTWRGAQDRFSDPGGREGAETVAGWGCPGGLGVPEIRQQVQGSHRASRGQFLSVLGLKAWLEGARRPGSLAAPLSLSLPS